MMPFDMLSVQARTLFGFWILTICLALMASAIRSILQKNYKLALLTTVIFVPAFFFRQVIFDLYITHLGRQAADLSMRLVDLPWGIWVLCFSVLTMILIADLKMMIDYGKNNVTPQAIQICGDNMPVGLCYWRDSGKVIFSNACMEKLCFEITGYPLLNGSHLFEAIKEEMMTIDGRTWHFVCRDLVYEGDNLHEMIASDVSEIYAKTIELQQDNRELSRLRRELQVYNINIDDTIRQQEILQAKVSIHDEMNQPILTTEAADSHDPGVLDAILQLWEQNAILRIMETDEVREKKARDGIDRLAGALGIELNWHGEVPEVLGSRQKELFYTAAQEAVANAAKHAEAKRMDIRFSMEDDSVCCTFENDGHVEAGPVRFEGGLANLERLAWDQQVQVRAEAGACFRLIMCYPTGPALSDRPS